MSLSIAGIRPPGVAPSPSFSLMGRRSILLNDTLVLTDGTNTLRITSVEVLLREVELKRAGVSDCDSTSHSDDCAEFETGAMLVSVPLVAGAATEITVAVDSGTYTEIELDIHKLGSDSTDNAFAGVHPTWPVGQSIRVRGIYNNGAPFTFVTDVDNEAEIQFVPPMVVAEGGGALNVTVRFDLDSWFRTSPGGGLIDPATANQGGPNKSLVDNNIKNALEAFEDDDRDGDERDG